MLKKYDDKDLRYTVTPRDFVTPRNSNVRRFSPNRI